MLVSTRAHIRDVRPRGVDGTYTIISGSLHDVDMVVVIDGQNFLVVLRPEEPGKPCEVFGYQPGSEDPDEDPVGVWDSQRQCLGLWDEHGSVAAWYGRGWSI